MSFGTPSARAIKLEILKQAVIALNGVTSLSADQKVQRLVGVCEQLYKWVSEAPKDEED